MRRIRLRFWNRISTYVAYDFYTGGGSYTGENTRGVMVARYKPWAIIIILLPSSYVTWCFRSLCLRNRTYALFP